VADIDAGAGSRGSIKSTLVTKHVKSGGMNNRRRKAAKVARL
jgi:hypothetical protein